MKKICNTKRKDEICRKMVNSKNEVKRFIEKKEVKSRRIRKKDKVT